jgi:hypothetical protein
MAARKSKIRRSTKRLGQGPRDASTPTRETSGGAVRFQATIHAGREALTDDLLTRLAIDRLPDTRGTIRALLTADDCVRVLEHGLELHLTYAHPIQPLDPSLIETDESFRRWIDAELTKIKRSGQ